MTDFKQLCRELVWLDQAEPGDSADWRYAWNAAIKRARAALAEPDQVAPTDKELAELYRKSYYECENRQGDAAQVFALRAVLACWGNHPGSPDSSTQPS